MFKFKKGVSPIIAAVLLVVITIAIGATTMAFIRSLSDQNLASAQEKSAKISCGTDVKLEVLAIGDSYKVCERSNSFEVTLKNTGSKNVKSLRLITLGNGSIGFDTTIGNASATGIDKNGIKFVNMTFNSTITGTPGEFQIEPVIQGQPGQDVICSDTPLKWDAADIASC